MLINELQMVINPKKIVTDTSQMIKGEFVNALVVLILHVTI